MLAPSLALAEDPARLLVRPRLIDHLGSVQASSQVMLLSGPVGIGRSTALRQWIGRSERVWLSADDLPVAAVVTAVDGVPARESAVVGASSSREDLDDLLRALVRHPSRPRVVVRGGPALGAETDRVASLLGRVPATVSPDVFHLTQGEIARLAENRRVVLTDHDVAEIVRVAGGYPAAVTRMLDHAVEHGSAVGVRWAEVAGAAVSQLVSHVGVERLITPGQLALADGLAVAERVPMDAAVELARRLDARPALRELQAFRLLGRLGGGRHVGVLEGFRFALGGAPLERGIEARAAVGAEGDGGRSRSRAATLTQVLWDVGHHEDALDLLEQRRRYDLVPALLERDLAGLADVPAARLIRALPWADLEHASPEVVLAAARAHVDITHAGHPGSVSSVACGLALDMVDLVSRAAGEEGVPALSPRAQVLLRLVPGVVARIRGDTAGSRSLLAEALERVRPLRDQLLHAAVATQSAMTHLADGDYPGAQRALSESAELGQDGIAALIARAGTEFVGRSIDVPAPREESDRRQEWVDVVPVPRMRSYGRAYRLLRALRTDEAAAELREGFGPIGSAPDIDPLVFEALRLHLECVLALVGGHQAGALRSIEVFEVAMAHRTLTEYEQVLVQGCRVEVLSALGEHERALAAVGPLDDRHVFVRRMRARALWESGRLAEAAALIEEELASPSLYEHRHLVWLLVLHALVQRDLGDRSSSDDALARALSLAPRSGSMMPFARHGRARLIGLLGQAAQLPLDHDARTFLHRLRSAFGAVLRPVVEGALSERELVVLTATTDAPDVRGLAQGLFVSPNTVKTQLGQIYRKLGVDGWEESVVVASALRAAGSEG